MTARNILMSAAGGSVDANYIEDVFSTWLATGQGTSFTINNGIDLSTKGGMVWMKRRSSAQDNYVYDTVRGAGKALITNDTFNQYNNNQIDSFTTTGFTGSFLANSSTNVFWTFRKQPKFFDIVTYTGDSIRSAIPHNLGSVPGCIIVKRVSSGATNWQVYHRGAAKSGFTAAQSRMSLNTTDPVTDDDIWTNTAPTSTEFYVKLGNASVNANAETYVAYLFAHDAGGFGPTGTDNVISCGGGTTDGNGLGEVTLGWEPQFVLYRLSNTADDWRMLDTMRGWTVFDVQDDKQLTANQTSAETTGGQRSPLARGFNFVSQGNQPFIYVAIRRGPMKVPTTGTSVFGPVTFSGTGSAQTINSTFNAPSVAWSQVRNDSGWSSPVFYDRLRGSRGLFTNQAGAEIASADYGVTVLGNTQTAMPVGMFSSSSGRTYVNWAFGRAPGFFDEVCYTGTGSARTVEHNLTVVPEMMIVKSRGGSFGVNWAVYAASLGATNNLWLNLTNATGTFGNVYWNSTTPTASVFSLGTNATVNLSGETYVAYLFASCPGVSKVGSFTGTGATQVINCGFTAGSRFVLIKSTSASGDWYVWDSARGIVAGDDPYLRINLDSAEVTNTDWIDPVASGFELSNAGGNLVNSSGVSYIFLAIA